MESFSSERFSLSNSNYFVLLFLRPIAALLFTISLLFLGWLLAWKLVLVHVPLVQEIFRLKEKPNKPKPPRRGRFTRFYNEIAQMVKPNLNCIGPVFKVLMLRCAFVSCLVGIFLGTRMLLQENEVVSTKALNEAHCFELATTAKDEIQFDAHTQRARRVLKLWIRLFV